MKGWEGPACCATLALHFKGAKGCLWVIWCGVVIWACGSQFCPQDVWSSFGRGQSLFLPPKQGETPPESHAWKIKLTCFVCEESHPACLFAYDTLPSTE